MNVRILALGLLVGVIGGVSTMEKSTMMSVIPFSGMGNSFFPTSKQGKESTSKQGEERVMLLSNPFVVCVSKELHNKVHPMSRTNLC